MSDQNNPQPYYPAPDPSQQFPPVNPSATNTLAIISLISGIAAYVFLPFLGAIAAVITGHIALKQIKATGENGRGFALTGTILGYVHLALSVLTGIIVVIILAAGGLLAVGSAVANDGAYPTPGVSEPGSYSRAQQKYDDCVTMADPTDADAIAACADQLAQG